VPGRMTRVEMDRWAAFEDKMPQYSRFCSARERETGTIPASTESSSAALWRSQLNAGTLASPNVVSRGV
jgi:hypothetical protein